MERPKIDNVNTSNNKRTLAVGLSFTGKTHLMLKILSKLRNQSIDIITESPLEQYSTAKKIKEYSEETKPPNEYENGILVFDDILGSPKSRYMDQIFITGRHNNLDVFYLTQSYFDSPEELYGILVTDFFSLLKQ